MYVLQKGAALRCLRRNYYFYCMMKWLLIVFLAVAHSCYGQYTSRAKTIDSLLTIETKKKMFPAKNITDSCMYFFFFNRQTNAVFRITTYRHKRDTIMNYLWAGNFLRVDMGIKKRFAIYYFEAGKLVGSKEKGLKVPDPYLFIQKGDLLRQMSSGYTGRQ